MLVYLVHSKKLVDIETQRVQAEMVAAVMHTRISREIHETNPTKQDVLYEEMIDLRGSEYGAEENPLSRLLYVPSFSAIKTERSLHVLHLRFRKVIPGDEVIKLLGKNDAAEQVWRVTRHTYKQIRDTHARMINGPNKRSSEIALAEDRELVDAAFVTAKNDKHITQTSVASSLVKTIRWSESLGKDGVYRKNSPEQMRARLSRALTRTGRNLDFKHLLKMNE